MTTNLNKKNRTFNFLQYDLVLTLNINRNIVLTLVIRKSSNFISVFFFSRNGCRHEGRGFDGRGADRGRAQPVVGGLQERHRRQTGVLENNLLHRTEGGEQGVRGKTQNDQNLQGPGTSFSLRLLELPLNDRSVQFLRAKVPTF